MKNCVVRLVRAIRRWFWGELQAASGSASSFAKDTNLDDNVERDRVIAAKPRRCGIEACSDADEICVSRRYFRIPGRNSADMRHSRSSYSLRAPPTGSVSQHNIKDNPTAKVKNVPELANGLYFFPPPLPVEVSLSISDPL